MKKLIIYTVVALLFACKSSTEIKEVSKTKKPKNNYTSCQLVEKEFINKGGKIPKYKELYLRCSVQDYFIKICEGKVSEKELRTYLNSGITVKMEIKEGMLDHCNENDAHAQSRTGTYVVIYEIVK